MNAGLLAKHRPYGLDCACGRPINSDADWARHIEALCTITDPDELDSLPVGSIIRDREGEALQCDLRCGAWFYPKSTYQFASDEVPMPVLVLWNPDWSKQ